MKKLNNEIVYFGEMPRGTGWINQRLDHSGFGHRKPCPKCQKIMIHHVVEWDRLPVAPLCWRASNWQWWCGCGHTEQGDTSEYYAEKDYLRAVWELVNSRKDSEPQP